MAHTKDQIAPLPVAYESRAWFRYVLAAVVVALADVHPLAIRLNHGLRLSTRLRTHFYDFALFALLGLALGFVVWLGDWAAARLVWARSRFKRWGALAVIGYLAGGTLLHDDLANFVGNHVSWVGPHTLGGIGGAVGIIGAVTVSCVPESGWQRVLLALLGCALGWINAQVLAGDYPGIHLWISLIAVVVLASVLPAGPLGATPQRWIVLALGLLVALALALPPGRSVRQGLAACSGSSLYPFAVHLLREPPRKAATYLAVESNPWFSDRSHAPAIGAQKTQLLPADAAVLFLTIDALRNDVMENRARDQELPNLARIRDESLRFTRARTPSPSTLTTVCSFLSGKYYSQLFYTTMAPGKVLPHQDRSVRLPEILNDLGVNTVQVLALRGIGRVSGAGRGFSREVATARDYGNASEVMSLIVNELEQYRAQPQGRLFLYSHFVDSHAPYTLGGKRATPFDSYVAELELVDRALGELISYLERHQLRKRVWVIISGDHGEAFGEHNSRFHACSVYDELLRVPLMFWSPTLEPKAIDVPVTLLDLTPTLLDLFGASTPGSFMGQSLFPLLSGGQVDFQRLIAADSGRRKQALFFPDGIKVILDLMRNTAETYDLNRDPKELTDLTDSVDFDAEPYILATERFFANHTLKIPGWKPPWRSF